MKLTTDIYAPPEPLTIGKGDQAFTLKIRRFNSIERLAVIDGIRSQSLALSWKSAAVIVEGWEGVLDKNGNPLVFAGKDAATGQDVNNFARMMAVPETLALQVETLAALIAFAGIPRELFQAFIDVLNDSVGVSVDADPTTPPPSATLSGASTA